MTEQNQLPPIKIAFVIDGKVVDVLHTDERMGAIFLSEPTIVDATDFFATLPEATPLVGGTWDGTSFTLPVLPNPAD